MSLDAQRQGTSPKVGRPGDVLLALPVRLHGIQLGHVVDVVLDAESLRGVGFEIQCGDDERRFLPFAAARIAEDAIELGSALLLLEGSNLSFYRNRTRSLRSLRGRGVERLGRPLGTLHDVVLADDASVAALAVESPAGVEHVALDGSVTIADLGTASAA